MNRCESHGWTELLNRPTGSLIVSCQPVPNGPTDTADFVVGFALAARGGGACGLRVESARYVAAVAKACPLPIIGLVKRDLPGSPVRITPFKEDVDALADAGASMIAFDATDRTRPVPVADLIEAIHARGLPAMADVATMAEAKAAVAAGADVIGSTLSGYTGPESPPEGPDLDLVGRAASLGVPVLAEGRYNAPALAGAAIRAGASGVVVGSAITRPEYVTGWFAEAVARARRPAPTILALDIGGTKILAALVWEGAVVERRTMPTPRVPIGDGWLESVLDLVGDWSGRYDGASAAVTGVVRDGGWFAANPAILPVPDGFPLAARLAGRLGVKVGIVNDAQAAAWGEYRFGAGRGRDLVFLTVSSGIGGGIVTDGRLWAGASGLAGSLGQAPVIVDGAALRLEARASGFGIAAAARDAGHEVDALGVFAAARSGADWAEGIIARSAGALAAALAGLKAVIDPEVVVLGGGVGLAPGYVDRVRRSLESFPAMMCPAVVPATLGADAGIIGAADLAVQKLVRQAAPG
ncbi:MAG TPA: putative N-acetylmannosamine-6-phosphate 2-epimerase [Alphaproteobacteria bacterium]|nr:putative N-acetylmannosamine-6-phosphate 2-epimerase [Alphaproteobacteria bacterium]